MKINENIKKLRNDRGLTLEQMGKMVGVSKQTIQRYESGQITTIPYDKIVALAVALQVSPSALMGWEAPKSKSEGAVRIPVYGDVAAGIPLEMITDIVDWEEIPAAMMNGDSEFFALRIHGDSMEPRIKDGDVVIVRKQNDAETGDIVIAAVNGDSATCKRLRKLRDGIELIPSNPSYEPFYFSNQEIIDKPVPILGTVVELKAKIYTLCT